MSEEWVSRRSASPSNGLPLVALYLLLFVVVVTHALLLPLGEWQMDEFVRFVDLRQRGWNAVLGYVMGWSPRPFSELLVWTYSLAVNRLGRPLIVECLGALWLGVFLALWLSARRTRRQPLAIALALFAAFLLFEKPGEAFYWPMAALAYLPGLAGLGAVCLLEDAPAKRPWLMCLALIVAAWSTEIAAAFILIEAATLSLLWIAVGRRAGPERWPIWLIAALAAGLVLYVTATKRLTISEIRQPGSPTLSDPLASLAAALPVFGWELAAVPFATGVTTVLVGLALKLMVFLGFRPGPDEARIARAGGVLAATRAFALLLAALVSIVLSFWQFGELCCERHDTFRQALIVLALYSLAQTWPSRQSWSWRAGLLAAPLFLTFAWRLPDIVYDWGLLAPTIAARAGNWHSGRSAGPDMIWRDPPPPHVAACCGLEAGHYTIESKHHNAAVLKFFGKQSLDVEPPVNGE